MPIGVFDSGLGGLTVLKALMQAAPNQSFVYLGDNANAPYGPRPPEEIYDLTVAGVERLFQAECRLVVIACNTAASVALRRLQRTWLPDRAPHRRVLGVFAPLVEAITGRRWGDVPETGAAPPAPGGAAGGARRVWFFATKATVESGAFLREAAARASNLDVLSIACPGLVDAIEAGDAAAAHARVRAAVAEAEARAPGAPDFAVLGCTHYPLVEPEFRAALPPGARMLDQPSVVAASLARYLERRPEFEDRGGAAPSLALLTSGDPTLVARRAEPFFGRPAPFAALRGPTSPSNYPADP